MIVRDLHLNVVGDVVKIDHRGRPQHDALFLRFLDQHVDPLYAIRGHDSPPAPIIALSGAANAGIQSRPHREARATKEVPCPPRFKTCWTSSRSSSSS